MKGFYENREEMRKTLEKYSQTPANRRLKYGIYMAAAVILALEIAMIIWMDSIPDRTMLFMRGCVGLAAIILGILATLLVYRSYRAYWRDRSRGRHG